MRGRSMRHHWHWQGLCLAMLSLGSGPAGAERADDPLHCLALSLYFEAREDGAEGMQAVGWVVLNRAADDGFPEAVCDVVTDGGERPPCQFSWWCDGRSDRPQDGEAWHMARQVARGLLSDPPPDPTDGATFFHAVDVDPKWEALEPTATIGSHVFYSGAFHP